MTLLTWIILFCLVGGALSVIIAAGMLLIPDASRSRLVPHFVSFAIGTLLGAAFLGLLPHALQQAGSDDPHNIMLAVLIGLLSFFLLEKLVLWRHCHADHCEAHDVDGGGVDHDHSLDKHSFDKHSHDKHSHEEKPNTGSLIVVGDVLHSFVDGVLIAAAFMTDILLGIVTSLAIASHEIPQQVSNFIVLLQGGRDKRRAFFLNSLSSIGALLGGVVGYFSLSTMQHIVPYIIAIAASSFIYIAVADLIPGLHKKTSPAAITQQVLLISCGVILVYFSHANLH